MSRICRECKVLYKMGKRLDDGSELHYCPVCGKVWIREDTIVGKGKVIHD